VEGEDAYVRIKTFILLSVVMAIYGLKVLVLFIVRLKNAKSKLVIVIYI
tara:strand:- start:570 stop:716 length:147 start_codon:yes stop_codon:yes gene_type:complete